MCIRASICIFFVNYTLFSSFEQLSLCSLLTVATVWILKAPLSEISPTAWPWSAVNRAAQSFYTIWVCGQENLQQYSMSEWSLLCYARRFSLLTLWSLMWQLFDSERPLQGTDRFLVILISIKCEFNIYHGP